MAKGDVRVVPGDKSWAVQIDGSARPRERPRTQKDAIQAEREAAKVTGRELLVHGRNGQIRERNAYGKERRQKQRLGPAESVIEMEVVSRGRRRRRLFVRAA